MAFLHNMSRTGTSSRLGVARLAFAGALAVYGLSRADTGLGDAPLFLLVIPLALCAFVYGFRGGVALGLFGSGIATVWWLQEGQPGGVAWCISRITAYLVVGAVLGHIVDSRRALARRIEHHSELSLDLIATASFDGFFTRREPRVHAHARLHGGRAGCQAVPRFRPPGRSCGDSGCRRGTDASGPRGAELPEPLPREGRHVPVAGMDISARYARE